MPLPHTRGPDTPGLIDLMGFLVIPIGLFVELGATRAMMLPFFSSRKNLFIIGSTPALVPAITDVELVGAIASSQPLRSPYRATSLASVCQASEV